MQSSCDIHDLNTFFFHAVGSSFGYILKQSWDKLDICNTPGAG